MKVRVDLLVGTALLGVAALDPVLSPAHAAIINDQDYLITPPPGAFAALVQVGDVPVPPSRGSGTFAASAVQTFTSAATGRLDSIVFQIWTPGPYSGILTYALIDGDYDAGARDIVAFGGLDFAQFGVAPFLPSLTFEIWPFDYMVSVGSRYSVLFEAIPFGPTQRTGLITGYAEPLPTGGVSLSPPLYEAGRLIYMANGSEIPGFNLDVGFATFVDVADADVPAPGALGLLGLGVIWLAARRRATR